MLQQTSGSHYNGLRAATSYNFTNAYCYVELVQAPAANTTADAMFTIGKDVDNYYRIFVESGTLVLQKKIATVKATADGELQQCESPVLEDKARSSEQQSGVRGGSRQRRSAWELDADIQRSVEHKRNSVGSGAGGIEGRDVAGGGERGREGDI